MSDIKEKINEKNFKDISVGDCLSLTGLEYIVKEKNFDAIVGIYYILQRIGKEKDTLFFDLIELGFYTTYRIKQNIPIQTKSPKTECEHCYFKGMDLIHVPGCSRYYVVDTTLWGIKRV